MTVSFSQDNIFPIIGCIIWAIYRTKHDYITHEVRCAQQTWRHEAPEHIVANMVAWFSQRMTVRCSAY